MNDDDQQRERFDMDNDYEGGVEIGGEFFYKAKRQKRHQSRDEQLYGVFADNSSDEEENRRRRGGKPAADYSKPLNFVSKGVGMGSAEHPPPPDSTAQPASQPKLVNGVPSEGSGMGFGGVGLASGGGLGFTAGAGGGSGGLGFSAGGSAGAGGGLGFTSSGKTSGGLGFTSDSSTGGGLGLTGSANGQEATKGASSGRGGIGSGGGLGFVSSGPQQQEMEEGEDVVLPSAFGKQIQRDAERRKKEKQQKEAAEKKRVANVQSGVGSFEVHTKGVASRMMAAMGYKPGEGLGRNKQGISKPVEAKLRPKGMGMGFGERPESKPAPEAKPAKAEADVPVQLWKKRNAAQRVKREYRTVEEVLAASGEAPAAAAAASTTILDMRGPQTRVVTNLEHLNVQEEGGAGEGVPMPELQHNLRLLVDLAEADIQKLDARLRHQQDTALVLKREKARLDEAAAEAAEATTRLGEVYAAVEHCGGAHVPLQELATAYTELQRRYPEEYVMYNLPAAGLAQLLPRLRQAMASWQPLQQPTAWVSEFRTWRPLLESSTARDAIFQDAGASENDPYQLLVSATVLPPLQSAISTAWAPREPGPLLEFFDAWEALLPSPLHRHVLDTLVYPKLAAAIEEWEPRKESQPLHGWVHPWLPTLGPQLQQQYAGVRHKVAVALAAWDPSDASALALLSPWHRVFDSKSWDALMTRSILPKLGPALRFMQINPAHQPPESLAPWHQAMAWAPYLSPGQAAGLLEATFWPNWHMVLKHWLENSPDMDQIVAWFSGWKSLLPQSLRDDERVRAQLNSALNAMHSAGTAAQQPAAAYAQQQQYAAAAGAQPGHQQPQPQPYAAAGPPPQPQAAQPPIPSSRWETAPAVDEDDIKLRELVENFAAEQGITFLPKPGRMERGLQVWSFGGVSITMDNTAQLIRAQVGDRWAPMSLDGLLSEQKRRSTARSTT